jgi:hypothetical protein
VSITLRRNSLATPPKRGGKKTHKPPRVGQKAGSTKPRIGKEPAGSNGFEPSASFGASATQEAFAPPKAPDSSQPNENRIATQPLASTSEHLTIFTVGHSTHPIEEFIGLLKHYGIEQLVDVRTVPKSRHVPQFNSDALATALGKQGIGYVHLKALGGLRHAKKDSVNTGWRNASFRGYADYMSTEEFARGIDRLIELTKAKRTVIMCAEAVPWRCHRSLIGDALLARGIVAKDIMSATSVRPHKLTDFAKVEGRRVTYPANANLELFER